MNNQKSTRRITFNFNRVLFISVVALLFSLPIKNVFVFSVDLGPIPVATPTKILGIVVVIPWFLYKLSDGHFKFTPSVILFLLFCVWAIGSLFWAENSARASLQVSRYLLGFGFLYIIWDMNQSVQRVDISTLAVVIGGCILVSWTLFNAISQAISVGATAGYGSRHGGGGYGGNNVANLIVIIIPFAWYLIGRIDRYAANDRTQQLVQTMLIGYIVVAGIAVLLTGSRQGIVGYFICVFALLYFSLCHRPNSNNLTRYVLFLLPGILTIFSLALLPQLASVRKQLNSISPTLFSPVRRIARLPQMLSAGNLSNRIPTWQQVLEEFWANPVIGSGAGVFEADNIFISTSANLGIIGFLLLVIPIALLFRRNVGILLSTGASGHVLAFLLGWGFMAGLNVWGNSPVVWGLFGLAISHTYVQSDNVTNKRDIS